MNNILSVFAALLICGSAAAQEGSGSTSSKTHSFTNKRGLEILPQKKEWAIGVSATSFLNYAGNLLNGNSFNTAPTFTANNSPSAFAIGSLGGMAVTGKYMKSASVAFRIRFQANAASSTMRNLVLKNVGTPDPLNPQYVEDEMTTETTIGLLGFGLEKRRGSGRIQGVYGAELLAGASGSRLVYNYGNPYTLEFSAPTTTIDFNSGSSMNVSSRVRESYSGVSMLFGARAFAGVEYFVASKLSIGGEFGYTLGFTTNSKGFISNETWYSANSTVANITRDSYPNKGIRSFGAGLDNINAGLLLHFYF